MKTTILALDLGTTTGWALQPSEGQTAHGFVSFKTQRFEGGGMRYLRFKRWLTELKNISGEIHAVHFEEIRRHAGVDAAHVYGGLMPLRAASGKRTAPMSQCVVPFRRAPRRSIACLRR